MRVLRSTGVVLALLGMFALAGCGVQGKGKGPKLPYAPKAVEPLPTVLMKTSLGDIELELFEDDCPNVVANFITLAEKGFYTNRIFHRIVQGERVLGGAPEDGSSKGPGYVIPGEFYDGFKKNEEGTIAMEKFSGTDQHGSQFFFNVKAGGNKALDGQRVVFGKITSGMDVVEKMAALKTNNDVKPVERKGEYFRQMDRPLDPPKILSVEVLKKRDHTYKIENKIPEKEAAKNKQGASRTFGGFNSGPGPRPGVVTETIPIPSLKKKETAGAKKKEKPAEKSGKETKKDVKPPSKEEKQPAPEEKKSEKPAVNEKKAPEKAGKKE